MSEQAAQQLRVGIVGCGEVTQTMHLPSLRELPDRFVVTALCDVSHQVLQGVGDRWQVSKRYTDYHDLVEQSDVELVLIANPNAYHAEVALAAIAAGKHLLIEKPMCITLREADEIVAAQERAGVTVQVAYMRRYAPAFVEATKLVREMGGIRFARVHDVLGLNDLFSRTSRIVRGSDVPQATIDEGTRRQADLIAEAIGEMPEELNLAYFILLALGTHDISAMRELLGRPQQVLYAAQRQGGMYPYLSAAFDYGDYVCHYETGWNRIAIFDASLEVYGDERIVRVKYDTPYVRNLPIRLFITEANSTGGAVERTVHPYWGDAFAAEWQALYDNITQGRTPKTSPADYRQDLELFRHMIALMRS